jgi:DNA-binding NtrC family response regulator
VPSLNERREDIPLLVEKFLEEICRDYGVKLKKMEPAALEDLGRHTWTGNIRELRNVVERLVILSGPTITAADVKAYVLHKA